VGNICPHNPRGNGPRHPLVIGEVDPQSTFLRRNTLLTIDDRRPGDAATLQLSNFHVREDRATREIVVHLSPFGRQPTEDGTGINWTGSAYIYRIGVNVRD
jgi:hypothetical protein